MSHSSCNEADFRGEGPGHFRSSGEQIWKLLCGVIGAISTPNDNLNTVFDDVVSLCRSCRNNALAQLVWDKLKLVAIFSLWCMWNTTPSNKNTFTWIVRRALNAIINRNKTETLILGGRGVALSCLNVSVKINADGFLPQETISIAFHGLEVAMHYTLKLVKGAIMIFILSKIINHRLLYFLTTMSGLGQNSSPRQYGQ